MVILLDAKEGLQVVIILLGLFQITRKPCILDYYKLSTLSQMPENLELVDLERVNQNKTQLIGKIILETLPF